MKDDYARSIICKHYEHIDNGGFTFKVIAEKHADPKETDEWYHLVMSNEFFGYSKNDMTFRNIGPDQLERLGKFFLGVSMKLKEKKNG